MHEADCRQQCSSGILEEYWKYVARERAELKDMPRCSKGWWSKSRRLLNRKGIVSNIPALRDSGEWVLDAKAEADLFVSTFSKKYALADPDVNIYSDIKPSACKEQGRPAEVTEQNAEEALLRLKEESGTGPDLLPTRKTEKLCQRTCEACSIADFTHRCKWDLAGNVASSLGDTPL